MTIIKPKLKGIHSPDIVDLRNHSIAENEPYCALIQAMFGPEGSDGEESFDLLVCNALWVAEESKQRVLSGRHHLIVSRFDIDEIRLFLEEIGKASAGRTWQDVAEKLGRYGKWEFEDYIE